MRYIIIRSFESFLLVAALSSALLSPFVDPPPALADASSASKAAFAVGPQYDTTHVYVPTADFDRFVASFVQTFGGTTSAKGVFTVTPTASKTMSQLALTPSGTVSVFGFETPIPYPFGMERAGYLVTDLDAAVRAARDDGADLVVASFNDPIGRDAIVQWPGGVGMQLYWHTAAPHYAPLQFVPENRVYVSLDRSDAFVKSFVAFSGGKVVEDTALAPGVEIGRAGDTYRRVRIESGFGKTTVFVTDGHLSYPYGRELTGYEVASLSETLAKAKSAGVITIVPPFLSDGRESAILQFPGGYVAEVHSSIMAVRK